MRFEWDDEKNASNLRKHGFEFDTALPVFDDPLHVTVPDGIVNGELRWITTGEVNGRYILVVVHTLIEEGEEIVRIIQPGKLQPMREGLMKVIFRREPGTLLSDKQLEQLKALEGRPIDTSDIPELSAEDFKRGVRGKFYRPVKQSVSLRLDADVIAWLKKDGQGYQTRANQMLRERMLKDLGLG
ncbi:BrnT family toxin [Granulicella sibirica]|uniref:Cytoplasmic protein n=1 Tax=Granulicella sibirica TaxID=2479048 RepID=A0A4Q0T361_9BACT|nr:BrnA antitoxin family protein [Granulicella sibirica]RXH58023.1 hypothetical protein GRAN_1333 [Granulicella sibirica]